MQFSAEDTAASVGSGRSCRCCATCTWSAGDEVSTSDLMEAAMRGNFHVIRHAVCVLGDEIMERRDEDGMTALHVASKRGHLPVVKFLLHCVGSTAEGCTAAACTQPCCCVNELVVGAGDSRNSPSFASFSSGTPSRPSSTSSSVGRIAKPRTLVPLNDSVNGDTVMKDNSAANPHRNSSSETFSKTSPQLSCSMASKSTASGASHAQLSSALSDAVESLSDTANASANEHLIAAENVGAKTGETNPWALRESSRGHTAMHWAALKGHAAVVNELINNGFDVHARSKLGATPLHLAVAAEKVEVANLLLNAGADPDARTNSGSTPIAAARHLRNTELLRLLSSTQVPAL